MILVEMVSVALIEARCTIQNVNFNSIDKDIQNFSHNIILLSLIYDSRYESLLFLIQYFVYF